MREIRWWWLAGAMATVIGCGDSAPSGNNGGNDAGGDVKGSDATPDAMKMPDVMDQDQMTPPDVMGQDQMTPPPDVMDQDQMTPPPDVMDQDQMTPPPDAMPADADDASMPTDGMTPGDATTCSNPMETACGSTCVNTATSNANCGSCGNACMMGQVCQAGVCTTPTMCPMNQLSCGGACIDPQTDANNCGTCGTVCMMGQSCRMGRCEATTICPMGQTACGGACVNTQTDNANCGTCGTACTGGQTCQMGRCQMMACPTGQMLCGTACANLQTDSANCGMCGRACAMGQTCMAGNCMGSVVCPMGQMACGAACADLQTDPANCGACGTACPTGQTCTAGRCQAPRPTCMTGQTDCAPMAATPTCVDLQTSNANCGACGRACPTGQTCQMGACACAMGQTLCDRTCVDLQSSNANCGACGRACPSGQACRMGTCACAMTGQTLCGGACVTTATDNNNCGRCGNVCPMGQTCTAGACACPMGQMACGTPATCVNTQTDRANCGRCGNACAAMGQTCTAGMCACPMGTSVCGTGAAAACVNLQTDSRNCGTCGTVCMTGTSCMAGRCAGTPPANDTRAGATLINLASPSQTISANTTSATNNTSSCRCTNGNDVFYRFVLTQPEVVYADTFGATWDTSLFLQDTNGVNLAGALAAAPNVVCNDDHQMAGFCTGTVGTNLQSQIAARLPAGTYYLVLSGCGSGTADIHFQHVPAGNGASARIIPSAMEQNATGTTSGTGSVTSTCCSGGADNTHWWITCPGTTAQAFFASTCNAMTGANLVGYDVEIAQYSALRGAAPVCNDDIGGTCGTGSAITSTIPATTATLGGLNALIADSCSGAGAYTVRYSLSAPCATGQSRCGTTCVDTNTSVNNCGACDRRCAAGNLCIAGNCIAPPANDTPAGATTINMANPQTIITGIDTRAAVNNTTGSCNCTSGNDIFFNFTIPAGPRQIIYADTLGSNWDTSLFVQTSTGTNVTASGLPTNGVACNDDGGLAGCGTGLQSQILMMLNPGAYRLVLSGCGAGGTTTNLRFQHFTVGNGAVAFLAQGNSTPAGATSGTSAITQICGGGTGPENTYYWHTCGAFTAANLTASTCTRATWDTVLSQRSPGRAAGDVCNDDVGGTCGVRSSVTAQIPAGAGVHGLFIDGFGGASGAYSISVSRP